MPALASMYKDQIPSFVTIVTMTEDEGRDELRAAIERGHFARASFLAESLGLEREEIKELSLKALWQIAAVSRNAPGTKILAQKYGFSKKEVKSLLEQCAEESRNNGNERPLKPCYDHSTGRYLSFEEWMDHLLKNWDKPSVS